MPALSPAPRPTRLRHRYAVRMLTYVSIDGASGGILRNLTERGIAAQIVGSLQAEQFVQVRFDLRHPRLRVEVRGQVIWANAAGQCGIRFVDLPQRMRLHINEWIFGNLLEAAGDIAESAPILGVTPARAEPVQEPAQEDDGLVVSAAPLKVIRLEAREAAVMAEPAVKPAVAPSTTELDWLSRPLSARSLAWTIDSLILIAAFLLFASIFLSITQELPEWPLSLAAALGAALFVPSLYCFFFYLTGGATLGARLARLTHEDEEQQAEEE